MGRFAVVVSLGAVVFFVLRSIPDVCRLSSVSSVRPSVHASSVHASSVVVPVPKADGRTGLDRRAGPPRCKLFAPPPAHLLRLPLSGLEAGGWRLEKRRKGKPCAVAPSAAEVLPHAPPHTCPTLYGLPPSLPGVCCLVSLSWGGRNEDWHLYDDKTRSEHALLRLPTTTRCF